MADPQPEAPFKFSKHGNCKVLRSSKTSLATCFLDVLTGSWMRSGDTGATNLREQLLAEQTNVGLVSALFLSVSVAVMVMADQGNDWERDWKVGTLAALSSVSNLCLVSAAILSVFVMLAVNECKDEAELQRFDTQMGFILQLPLLLFILGVNFFGGVVVNFWFYCTLSRTWFFAIAGSAYALGFFVLVPGVLKTLQILYRAKDDRSGLVSIEADQVAVALKAEAVTPLTQLKMETVLEAFQQEVIKKVGPCTIAV